MTLKRLSWEIPEDKKDLFPGQSTVSLGVLDAEDTKAIEAAKKRVLDQAIKATREGRRFASDFKKTSKRLRSLDKANKTWLPENVQQEAEQATAQEFEQKYLQSIDEEAKSIRRQLLGKEARPYRFPEAFPEPEYDSGRTQAPASGRGIYREPGPDGKFRSSLSDQYLLSTGQQPITFDTFEEARVAHQSAFGRFGQPEVGPPTTQLVDPDFATKAEMEFQQYSDKAIKAKDIYEKSKKEPLSAEDYLFVYNNKDVFNRENIPLNTPRWLDQFAQREAEKEKQLAPQAAREVSSGFAGVVQEVDPVTKQKGISPLIDKSDEELKAASAQVAKNLDYGEEVQEAARQGVLDVRKERQKSFREAAMKRPEINSLRGKEREDAINTYSKEIASVDVQTSNPLVRGFALEDPQANRRLVESNLRRVKVNDQFLDEETIQRSLEDYDWLRSTGAVTDAGTLTSPEQFWSSVWKRVGGSGGASSATPIGGLISRHLKTNQELAEQSAQAWKEIAGQRARNVDAQESGFAKTVETLYNLGEGMYDMYLGIYSLLDGDSDEERIKILKNAYKDYLVDNRGGRPVFSVENQAIEREQNAEAVAGAIEGFKESFKRMVTDTKDSLKGDPFGFIANAIMVGRLATSIGLGNTKISKFLAAADNALTGLPAGVWVAKNTVGRALKPAFGPLARKASLFLRGPSRVELIVERARNQSEALGLQAEEALGSLQKKVDEGKDYNSAVKETLSEASEPAAEFLAGVFLENHGLFSGAKNVDQFIGSLPGKRQIFEAVLDNDTNRLVDLLPDEVLESAGLRPAFTPDELTRANAAGLESILVDSTILSKKIDDHLAQLTEQGRDAERLTLLAQVGRLRDQIRKADGGLVEPRLMPDPAIDKTSDFSVPKSFDLNPGVDNQALLVAAVREADGKPIRVTINSKDKTFFEGPLVGPEEIIGAIPVEFRTRLPIYQRIAGSRAPELVEEMIENGNTSDLALYLKRSVNLKRAPESQKSFERLEKYFEETTGVSVEDLYEKTRLGGLTENADTAMELVVRRSSKVPGAPQQIPSLYGIPRTQEYVGSSGRAASVDLPTGAPFEIGPSMTRRQRETAKAQPQARAELEAMERQRMDAARQIREEGTTPQQVMESSDVSLKGRDAKRVADAIDGKPMFTAGEQSSLVSQLMDRQTAISKDRIASELNNKEALVATANDQIVAMRMQDELQFGDDVANGVDDWQKRSMPLLFSGTVDDVSSKLTSRGKQGEVYVRDMDLAPVSDEARKAMRLGDGDYAVPAFVNDAFELNKQLRETRARISGLLRSGSYVNKTLGALGAAIPYAGMVFKRYLTSRNPLTGIYNATANAFLRAFVDGSAGPGLGEVWRDLSEYKKSPSSMGLETRAIMDAAEEAGILSGNVLVDDIKQINARMPSEVVEDVMDAMSSKVSPRFEKALSTATLVRPVNWLLNKIEKAYGATDVLFKLDHMYTRVKGLADDLDLIEPGNHITLNVDKGLYRRVYRADDGSFRLGSLSGKALSRDELVQLLAKDAAQGANRLYFDYADVPRGLGVLRSAQLDGVLMNPFLTWAWKSIYLPTLKGGLAREIMTGGKIPDTNSPALQKKMYRNILARELTRSFIMNTSADAGRKQMIKLPEIVRMQLAFGPSPFFGSVRFGEIDSWVTSRGGLNSASAQRTFMGALRSFFRDVPEEINRNTSPWEERSESVGNILSMREGKGLGGDLYSSRLKNLDKKKTLNQARKIWEEMIKDNPDGHKQFIYEVRSAHPMYDYNAMNAIGKMLQLDRPMFQSLAELTEDDRVKPEDAYAGMAIGSIVGSKGLNQIAKDGWKVLKGDYDAESLSKAIGKKKVSNSYFLKKQNYLTREQLKRWAVENDYAKNKKDNEETRRRKEAYRMIADIITSLDAIDMGEKLSDKLEQKGIEMFRSLKDRWDVFPYVKSEFVGDIERRVFDD